MRVRNLKRLIFFVAGCVLGAALVSPWIYLGLQEAAKAWGTSGLIYLAKHPFHRVFHRVLQVELLVGIVFLLKRDGFFSLESLGLKGEGMERRVGLGFVSGLAVMGVYAWLLVAIGWQRLDIRLHGLEWAWLGARVGATAVVVALAEEVLFRGYFFQLCRRGWAFRGAVVVNMVVFAAVHFAKPARAEDLGAVDWSAGFRMLGMACARFGSPSQIVGGVVVLMVVAWMLCWTVERTRNLHLAIGLHAGWICAQQWSSELTHPVVTWRAWVLGGGDLRDGVMTVIPLLLQFVLVRWWWLGRKPT